MSKAEKMLKELGYKEVPGEGYIIPGCRIWEKKRTGEACAYIKRIVIGSAGETSCEVDNGRISHIAGTMTIGELDAALAMARERLVVSDGE